MKTSNSITISNRTKKGLLMLINEKGLILDANHFFNQTFFHSENLKPGYNIYDILHARSKAAFKSAMQKVMITQNPYVASLLLQNDVLHKQFWNIKKLTIQSKEYFLCTGIDTEKNLDTLNELTDQKEEFNDLKMGILVHGKNDTIIEVNQDAADLLGHSVESLKTDVYLQNIWKNKKSGNISNAAELLKNQTVAWLSGENESSNFNFYLLNTTDGENKKHSPTITCFYELKTNQQLPEENPISKFESIFSDFFSKSGSMKWIADANNNLLFANISFLKFFNLKQDVITRNLYEIFPKTLADLFHTGHKYVLENHDLLNHIQHSRQADGNEFYLLTNLHSITIDPASKLIGGEAIDITETTRSKKELTKATERLEIMTKNTTDAIWEWNIKTGDIFRNEALHNLIGYQPVETDDLSWWYDHIHPDDREKVEQKISYTLSHNEQSWEQEYRFKRKDGIYMQVFDRGYVIYEYDVPYKMIGTIQDLSKLKALEASLYDEKIQNQKDIAEAIISVQEKERTNLGHELHDNVNQILMTAKLYLGMLEVDEPDKKELKDKAIDYIMESIEEIKILSKKLVIPQLKEGGLIPSIKSLADDIQFTTKLQIHFEYEEEVELMLQNKKVTFFRIVQEQLKNIIKHSQATHVDIKLLGLNTAYFQLFITDNGVGFDASMTRHGIGLSNIHERVKLYEGEAIINSSPGNGCELQIMIPK